MPAVNLRLLKEKPLWAAILFIIIAACVTIYYNDNLGPKPVSSTGSNGPVPTELPNHSIMMNRLKNICYRGGIARFEIPASWKEEYEPSGGATFYEDRPDSGTLRLNVLAFRSNGNVTGEQSVENMIAKSGYKELRDGLAIKQYVKSAGEDLEPLRIHYWQIAIPVQGCNIRLAIFSYTILASQATDKQILQEIELLEKCIQNAEFSREQGVGGDYQHE